MHAGKTNDRVCTYVGGKADYYVLEHAARNWIPCLGTCAVRTEKRSWKLGNFCREHVVRKFPARSTSIASRNYLRAKRLPARLHASACTRIIVWSTAGPGRCSLWHEAGGLKITVAREQNNLRELFANATRVQSSRGCSRLFALHVSHGSSRDYAQIVFLRRGNGGTRYGE